MASTRKNAVFPQLTDPFSDHQNEDTHAKNYHNRGDNRIIRRGRRVRTEKTRRWVDSIKYINSMVIFDLIFCRIRGFWTSLPCCGSVSAFLQLLAACFLIICLILAIALPILLITTQKISTTTSTYIKLCHNTQLFVSRVLHQ